jgi:DNA-binding MarR family transcriptional regulator
VEKQLTMNDKTRSVLDSLIGGKIGSAYLQARRLFRAHMTDVQLSPIEFYVLALISSSDLHQSALSLALNISTQNLTLVLERLAQRNFITRVQSKTDGRVRLIHLTAEGSRVIKHALDEIVVVEAELTSGLSPGERLIFSELLDKVTRSSTGRRSEAQATVAETDEEAIEVRPGRKKKLKAI